MSGYVWRSRLINPIVHWPTFVPRIYFCPFQRHRIQLLVLSERAQRILAAEGAR